MVCSLPGLLPADLVAAVAAWNEILEDIPTEWLDECYKRAMKAHRIRDPFSAAEVCQQWAVVHESQEYRFWIEQHNRRLLEAECPHGCQGGWIFTDPSGNIGGVKPCPEHRKQFARSP